MSRTILSALAVLLLLGAALARTGRAAPPEGDGPPAIPTGPTAAFKFTAGVVRQFDADLDEGGDFHVSRFFLKPGVDIFFSRELQTSLGLGYSRDRYAFSGREGLAGLEPWEDIETARFSAFTRYAVDESWTLFGAPAVQFSAERGGSRSDGVTYGFFAGASFEVSDSLTIGPGVGYFSEIEDDGTFFPFLLIDWKIADRLALRTGQGTAASRGPGLVLEWTFAADWALSLGGRWEKQRFRLDDDDVAPDGVGQEESIAIFLNLTYEFAERSSVSILAGANFGGELRLFDKRGRKLEQEDYDTVGFLGLAITLTF